MYLHDKLKAKNISAQKERIPDKKKPRCEHIFFSSQRFQSLRITKESKLAKEEHEN